MDHRKRLIAALIALVCAPSYAAYASLSPPAGYVSSGTARSFVRAAANDAAIYVGNTVRTSASLSVAGRSVTMPVTMRIAANAGLMASRFAFLNPALMVGTVAAAAYLHYTEQGYRVEGNRWFEQVEFPGFIFRVRYWSPESGTYQYTEWSGSPSRACAAAAGGGSGGTSDGRRVYETSVVSSNRTDCVLRSVVNELNIVANPPVWYELMDVTGTLSIEEEPAPVSDWIPVKQEDFERAMAPLPLPDTFAPAFPGPLPVEKPILNPSDEPNPLPQPMRVPMGDPVPVPNTDPQQWRTPVVDIVPSPTALDPWRVDLRPQDLDRLDATPLTDPYTVPSTPPVDETVTPNPDAAPTPGLCEMFPDILACAKPELDTPDGPEVQNQNRDITITPDTGWGGGGGSCPASRHLSGANVEFSFAGICDGLSKFRPVILAFAWLSAAFILLGMRQGAES